MNGLTDAAVFALISSMERQQATQIAMLVEMIAQLRASVDALGALINAQGYRTLTAEDRS